jgi:DNA mismatch repair protein MutL
MRSATPLGIDRLMPIIRQLPAHLVNKIAAGEVIERPASVVKELLENSIDSGATRIDVHVDPSEEGLIRISDDGCGIAAEQLPLAVASHATSKLPTEEALFEIETLGFRGEALASISAVSHLRIQSRPQASEQAAELTVHGGIAGEVIPCGGPPGTTIEIRQLFFNTPVRRRFLRAANTEMGHIVEAFTRVALGYPRVAMRLSSAARTLYDLPGSESWSERIETFVGSDVADALIAVSSDDGEIKLHGYVADPSVSRPHNRLQYFFLNGRHIRDRALQHALQEAYRGLLMVGRQPVAFLRLEMPPAMVDVNVHPTKLEVRFADGGRIYGQLLQTLRNRFLSADLTMRVRSSRATEPASSTGGNEPEPAQQRIDWGSSVRPRETEIPPFRRFDDGSTGAIPAVRQPVAFESSAAVHPPAPIVPRQADASSWRGAMPAPETGIAEPSDVPSAVHELHPPSGLRVGPQPPSAVPSAAESRREPAGSRPAGMQIHNRYLITEDERGLVVVDQHALHERILYERIRDRVLSGQLESQRLLVPEPLRLKPAELAAVTEARDLFAKVGIDLEPFGGDTILIRSYPAMLANMPPAEMLSRLLEELLAGKRDPEARDVLDGLLHSMACKAAIKAGDRLTGDEIAALLAQRELYEDTHHCPHGRPTALIFSREELDRMFGRLGAR